MIPSRLAIIATATLCAASALTAATIGGYALGHPDTEPVVIRQASVTEVPSSMCEAGNGDTLVRVGEAWHYLPEPSTLALPGCPDEAYAAPVTSVTEGGWTVDTISDEDKAYILANVLPYYRVDAPKWCADDLPCWIGSNADTRTDAEIFAGLREDIVSSSEAYADGTIQTVDGE